ncbi:MAG: polyisoprenoid-binding protein [Castellaniella sp.]|uniref:YceI family protein n=1 Tax=Castellaniella sp. TaxID=1955812 RepID=UPI0012241903|nr:YceI family protein [Castellaniella sp.]TAN27917.1 MAG: polyisoprenoid-binding protein [Castellaniella sp.]
MSKVLAIALLGLSAHAFPAYAQNVTYDVEPDHSFVTFGVVHNGTSTTRGRFDTITGTVDLDQTAKKGQADIRIDPTSINSGSKGFDEHLRSKDFFNVAAFPDARFQSQAFAFEGDKISSVSGTLTLLGVQKPVTLRANRFNCYQNKRTQRDICGGDFEATIQRSQWGMNFGLPGIPDTVRLVIQIEAIKRQ